MITIEYNGVEKIAGAAGWGFAIDSVSTFITHRAASTFTGSIPGENRNSTPTFPFEARIIVRRERTWNGVAWTGGYIDLIAYRMDRNVSDAPGEVGASYLFEDWWGWLARTLYQQPTKAYNPTLNAMGYTLTPDCLLFTKISEGHAVDPDESPLQAPGVLIGTSNGKQIKSILQFVLAQNVAQGLPVLFQIGQIDPDLMLNTYPVRSMFCDQAIEKCLELEPNVTIETDYTTTPPTVNVLRREHLESVTLELANRADHVSIRFRDNERAKLRGVVIWYRFTNTFDGEEVHSFSREKFGPNGLNHANDPEAGHRVHVDMLDLAGVNVSTVRTRIETRPMITDAASQAARLDWWQLHHPALASTKIRNATIGTLTITDELTGAAVSVNAYPNELMDGTILPWMRVGAGPALSRKVKITATITSKEFDTEGSGTAGHETKEGSRLLSVNRTLTNASTGDFSSVASLSFSETPPTGIAQRIFEEFNLPRIEGEDIRVSLPISNAVRPGNAVNFSNGRAELASMNALVRSVTKRDSEASASVSFGPPLAVGAADMVLLSQFARRRRVFENPGGRASGAARDSGGIEL